MTAPALTSPIDAFVEGLVYDPNKVLAVVQDGDVTTQPVTTKGTAPGKVIVTTTIHHTLSKNLSDVALLRPTSGVVFPGAIVLADTDLANGQPTPVGLARKPITVSIDLPGLQPSEVTVADPTASSVQDAVTSLVNAWFKTGNSNPARSFLETTTAFSSQQASLGLDVNAKWASGDASAVLNVSSDSQTSTFIASYKQVYFTATIDTPANPSAFFADSVTVDDLKAVASAAHPPAYVRSVDFGRILLIKMTTTMSTTTADLKAAFTEVAASATGSGSVDAKYSDILKNSTFQVLALGGSAKSAATFTGEDQTLANLKAYIQDGAGFASTTPGAPISYSVAFMKDNRLATMGFTTDYTETNSVVYNDGQVKLWQDGWYAADFAVTWQERDSQGNLGTVQTWDSGVVSLGYTKILDFAGDATNIRIHATEDSATTNGWMDAMDVTLSGPDNQWYRIYGTTLSPHWDNESHD